VSRKREYAKSKRNQNAESLTITICPSPANEGSSEVLRGLLEETTNEGEPVVKSSLFRRPSIFGPLSTYERLASFFGVSDGSPSDRGVGSS